MLEDGLDGAWGACPSGVSRSTSLIPHPSLVCLITQVIPYVSEEEDAAPSNVAFQNKSHSFSERGDGPRFM